MAEGKLLPLFPLPVVLFPGAALPLHIFEERYRLMIGDAARDHSEFGVLLAEDGKLATVGCTATVERVVREYDSGEFDVATEGRRRYRTLSLDQTKPYLQAWVEFFDDEDDSPPEAVKLDRALELGRRVAQMLSIALPDLDEAARPSFLMAQHLPFELEFRQQLLALRAESKRIDALSEQLEKLSVRVQQVQQMQKAARTNGHGPH